MNKIFGIGFSKSGTSSLNDALKLLGFRSIHYPWNQTVLRQLQDGHFHLAVLEKYDAITELALPYFRDFDREFPNSKFILTYRDWESWSHSIRSWYENKQRYLRDFRIVNFGCHVFSPEHFRDVYEDHHARVFKHFENREDDLLILNICGGEGWGKLCPFLGCDIPDLPFPHKNQQHYILYQ